MACLSLVKLNAAVKEEEEDASSAGWFAHNPTEYVYQRHESAREDVGRLSVANWHKKMPNRVVWRQMTGNVGGYNGRAQPSNAHAQIDLHSRACGGGDSDADTHLQLFIMLLIEFQRSDGWRGLLGQRSSRIHFCGSMVNLSDTQKACPRRCVLEQLTRTRFMSTLMNDC